MLTVVPQNAAQPSAFSPITLQKSNVRVNNRVSPAEVRDVLLAGLDATIINWIDEPEALEWRQSETTRRGVLHSQHRAP
jgi:hypothetical protein